MSIALTEAQMAEAFEKFMATDACVQASALPQFADLKSEVNCLQGRPDFIGIVDDKLIESKSQAESLADALATPSLASIMALLKPRALRRQEYLVRMTGLSVPVVHRALLTLERQEIVRRNGSGYVLAPHVPNLRTQLWAFELKLDHWKRALFQACQYQAFAHATVVVMPEDGARRVERHRDRFESLGIGLAAFDAVTHGLRILVQPAQRRPLSQRHYLFALGQVLARQLQD